MVTRNYNRNSRQETPRQKLQRRTAPNTKLDRVFRTLGEEVSGELGLEKVGNGYNLTHMKSFTVERGVIYCHADGAAVNSSSYTPEGGSAKQFGCIWGTANISLEGRGSFASELPVAILPPYKMDQGQEDAAREDFAAQVEELEAGDIDVNPSSMDLFIDGKGASLVVIQANGVYGADTYWTMRHHPVPVKGSDEPEGDEDAAAPDRDERTDEEGDFTV